jgi:hypothetical protein
MASITRSQQYRRIVTVLIEEGFGTVLDQLGLRAPWIASLRAGRAAAGADAYLTPEERARRTMERLGPTFAKIGQLLSVRPDLVPASYADQLAKLQDEMEPFPFAEARDEIESAFGSPLAELFELDRPRRAGGARARLSIVNRFMAGKRPGRELLRCQDRSSRVSEAIACTRSRESCPSPRLWSCEPPVRRSTLLR